MRRAAEAVYLAVRYPALLRLGGRRIAANDAPMQALLDHPGVKPLAHWRPTFSAFSHHNQLLTFDVCWQHYFAGAEAQRLIRAVSGIVVEQEPEHRSVRLTQCAALTTSKSDTTENINRWASLTDLGRWSFCEYLPSTIGGTTDPIAGRDRLAEVFRKSVVPARGGFHGVRHLSWCGRYVIANSGISRRLAALVYLANQGNRELATPVTVLCRSESICPDALQHTREAADVFAMWRRLKRTTGSANSCRRLSYRW